VKLPITIYLIRHATPDWSRTDIPYHVPPGPPLTPQGESEAKELGEYLRDTGIVHLEASPLERCSRTASIAAEIVGVKAIQELGLSEWTPDDKRDDVQARIMPVVDRASQSDEPIALVTHGGPIRLILEELGLDSLLIEHYRKLFDRNNPVPPAGAWKAERSNGTWKLTLAFVPDAYKSKLVV